MNSNRAAVVVARATTGLVLQLMAEEAITVLSTNDGFETGDVPCCYISYMTETR